MSMQSGGGGADGFGAVGVPRGGDCWFRTFGCTVGRDGKGESAGEKGDHIFIFDLQRAQEREWSGRRKVNEQKSVSDDHLPDFPPLSLPPCPG